MPATAASPPKTVQNSPSRYNPGVRAELAKLWQYRELIPSLVSRDLKVRYKRSFLGFFWSLINPLLTVFVISYTFKTVLNDLTQSISAYILAAYLPYMFFSMAVMDATSSVQNNLGLVKKIYFPREILPIASIISNFIHFLLAMGVFFAYLLAVYAIHPQTSPFQWTSIYLPLLLVINFVMACGFGLLFSALNTFYEDVKYIVGFVMQMLLFLSPIMYFVEKIYYVSSPRHWFVYNAINPLAVLCNAYRKILLAPQPVSIPMGDQNVMKPPLGIEWGWIAYAGVLAVVVFVVGYSVFNRYKWKFVERP